VEAVDAALELRVATVDSFVATPVDVGDADVQADCWQVPHWLISPREPIPRNRLGSRVLAEKGSRICAFQLFKFGLNFCPVFWPSLSRIRSIRMPKEFDKFGPHRRRSTTEILLRQRVEPLRMRLIVEPIFSRPCYLAGVKIVVR
jgi:hypothetical protein